MTEQGTAAYDAVDDLPPLVRAAVNLARSAGFPYCCLPEQSALLRLLAGGVGHGTIGETGTGYGAGLAWLATGASATILATYIGDWIRLPTQDSMRSTGP